MMMELELSNRHWWAFAERGSAPILFGMLAFVRPAITLTVLVLLWGAFALVDGVWPLITGALGLIAAHAIVFGVPRLALAFRLRGFTQRRHAMGAA
jgi:hypothetical protein